VSLVLGAMPLRARNDKSSELENREAFGHELCPAADRVEGDFQTSLLATKLNGVEDRQTV